MLAGTIAVNILRHTHIYINSQETAWLVPGATFHHHSKPWRISPTTVLVLGPCHTTTILVPEFYKILRSGSWLASAAHKWWLIIGAERQRWYCNGLIMVYACVYVCMYICLRVCGCESGWTVVKPTINSLYQCQYLSMLT